MLRTDDTPAEVAGLLTQRLAEFIASTTFVDLPDHVVERMRMYLLDFLVVAAAGAHLAESSPAFRAGTASLDAAPAGEGATVIASTARASLENAALLNGIAAHSLDFDDTHLGGALHPGAPVWPAVLALAEHRGADGRALLTAAAVGYEVTCRVGMAIGQSAYDRGFHPTGVAGTFGAAAAAAALLRLDADAAESAIGLAGSSASGSMQFMEDGSWNKRLHPGLAARNGLLAAALAEAGVKGSRQALEGRRGALLAFSAGPDVRHLVPPPDRPWTASDTGIKPYPACRATHGAIDAALQLRDRDPGVAGGSGVLQLRLEPRAVDLVGRSVSPKLRPQNTVDAQFSVFFQVAVTLLAGAPGWNSYAHLDDEAVLQLIDRIEIVTDPTIPTAGAELRSGSTAVRVDVPSGEPATLTWEDLERKSALAMDSFWSDELRRRVVETARGLGGSRELPDLVRVMREM
ncbi:MmgE/PrpD family protein [Pseudonocardia kujensis]|uniref:MmgE/PrpD family protein n=1 Tax=Pseudonocardia kujensis TaxID=1128675 RepID=UPI001E57E7CC|nr:MmgE/PrpD family protein [Pseudonocardia kujensis]MCE0768769.1 MmgE/PrpD family protein [Pseudonocardia kujensis]